MMNFSLFYFERKGERTYLRFTRLGVAVILLLTVVPLAVLFIFLLVNSRATPASDVNTNIRVLPASPPSVDKPIIQKAPPLRTPQKAGKQPAYSAPTPQPTHTPDDNGQLRPNQQPPPPSKPPT
jgi:hypothetical protein